MKRLELIIAGTILGLSTVLKICAVVMICQLPLHGEETVHELVQIGQEKTQTSHQPIV